MVQSKAKSVGEYLKELPPPRREAVQSVQGYEEGMLYGMIGYCIPLRRYPETCNGQPLGCAGLASQNNYISLYLMGVYMDPADAAWFEAAWKSAGKKLDMGKACIRFKKLDDVPLDVVGDAIARMPVERLIRLYEGSRRKKLWFPEIDPFQRRAAGHAVPDFEPSRSVPGRRMEVWLPFGRQSDPSNSRTDDRTQKAAWGMYTESSMAKVGFVSLGCAKNLVDSEVMMGLLAENGFDITSAQREADVIVVNTCGFIDRAKEESVEAILEMAREKEVGKCRRLIVAGCLVERYRDQILREIPEVDAVVGVNEIPEILKVCAGETATPTYERRELFLYSDRDPRLRTTPPHSAYVKIAEGCDHPCTFCVIPKMRGRFRSRSIESVVSEARRLAEQGVREVNLVAQDSTMFGWDRGDRKGLARLLSKLNEVDGLEWVRFLYAYPNNIYDDLLVTIAECEKVCNYIDVPLQHASREVLRRMKRGGNRGGLTRLISRIRAYIPDVTIRTTMIVGFPGETEEDFRDLLEFVEEARFDRLGAFTYSDEEDAESFRLERRVPEEVKEQRKQRLMELQSCISQEKNRELIGRVAPILIEGPSRETELLWEGRLQGQAPEIDGVVYLNDGVSADTRPGEFGRVSITEAHPHDLVGALVS